MSGEKEKNGRKGLKGQKERALIFIKSYKKPPTNYFRRRQLNVKYNAKIAILFYNVNRAWVYIYSCLPFRHQKLFFIVVVVTKTSSTAPVTDTAP